MQWLRVPVQLADCEASDQAIAAWLRLCLHLAAMETPAVDLPDRPLRSWPLSAEEYQALLESPLVDGRRLLHAPDADISAMDRARACGARGGRPKKAQSPGGKTLGLNPGVKPGGKTLGLNPGGKPWGETLGQNQIREDKRREDRNRQDENAPTHPHPREDDPDPGPDPEDMAAAMSHPTAGQPDAPPDDATLWRMGTASEEWARALKAGGCKIGPGNWRTWRGVLDDIFAGDLASMIACARRVPADRRWPDQVEEHGRRWSLTDMTPEQIAAEQSASSPDWIA